MANPSGLYFSSDPMASASSAPPPSSVPSSSLPPAFEGFPSAHMSLLELELHNERVNKLQSKKYLLQTQLGELDSMKSGKTVYHKYGNAFYLTDDTTLKSKKHREMSEIDKEIDKTRGEITITPSTELD